MDYHHYMNCDSKDIPPYVLDYTIMANDLESLKFFYLKKKLKII